MYFIFPELPNLVQRMGGSEDMGGRDESMIITHKIKMDLTEGGACAYISTVQDDQYSRNVELELLHSGVPWTIPEDVQAVISYCKFDGTVGQYDCLPDGSAAWSVSENFLTAALAPQVLTAQGKVIMAVKLIRGKQVLNTFSFTVDVRGNPGTGITQGEGETSENYLNVVLSGKLDRTGWTPNQYLGTDENGTVVEKEAADALPAVTEADEGKFLRVSGGVWAAETLERAEEVAY